MGLLSFGGSSSNSLGFSRDQSSSASNSFGASADESVASAVSAGTSNQAIAFESVFGSLFNNAASRALTSNASPAQALFSGGLDFLDQLQNNAGVDALSERVSGANNILQGNLDALQESLGRLFSEEINPAITSDAIGAGALGGGRQGVAQGLGARAVAEQFTQGATSLITADQQQRDQAATTLAGILSQGAGLGLQNLEGLAALGTEGQINLAPLSALAEILGGPTVLTQAEDFSTSLSESLGQSFQEASSESRSFGTSSQSARSGSFNVGIL